MFTPNYPFYDKQHTLHSTPERMAALPDYTGRGVVMAFLDTGFYPHPDLGDRIFAHIDATTARIVEGGRFGTVEDPNWHGQMVSVIAAGNGEQYRGIAADAHLVLIKISDTQGRIPEANIIRGLNWLIKHHAEFNIRILTIAVGGSQPSTDPKHPMYKALRTLTENGLTIFAAAGNRGQMRLIPPASSPHVITVGGIDDQNSPDKALWQAYPNNYGKAYDGTRKPDVIVPARWIASPILPGSSVAREAYWLGAMLNTKNKTTVKKLLREGYADLGLAQSQVLEFDDKIQEHLQQRIHALNLINAYYQHAEGTSVAVAIAASVAAQILEANPRLTPFQVKDILTLTAKPFPKIPSERQGYGIIDAANAVLSAIKRIDSDVR